MALKPPSDEIEAQTEDQSYPVDVPEKFTKNEVQKSLPPIEGDTDSELGSKAKGYVSSLLSMSPTSPEFAEKIREVEHYGQTDIRKSADIPNRILSDRMTSIAGTKKSNNKNDATVGAANALGRLRVIVDDLAPGVDKGLAKFLPGANRRIQKYLQRYASSQEQLDGIVRALLTSKDELRRDNAALAQEEKNLWKVMGSLNEHIVYTEKVSNEIKAEVNRLKSAGQVEEAGILERDVLFTVNQRRQDLLVQLAVAAQGYTAMGLIRTNNIELIKGVERAQDTTVVALRTSVLTTHALTRQKATVDTINALNETTNRTLLANGELMKQTTTEIHAQATSSGIAVETITKVFRDLDDTLTEIENFKAQANEKFDATISALTAEMQNAKPAIDRVHAITNRNPEQMNSLTNAPSSRKGITS